MNTVTAIVLIASYCSDGSIPSGEKCEDGTSKHSIEISLLTHETNDHLPTKEDIDQLIVVRRDSLKIFEVPIRGILTKDEVTLLLKASGFFSSVLSR